MKRILMVLEKEFPPDVRVKKEIEALSDQNYMIYLLCSTRNKENQGFEKYGKNVYIYRTFMSRTFYNKLSPLALLIPFYFNFWKKQIDLFLKKNSVDLIHIHDLPLLKLGVKFSKKYNLKLVVDYHENRPEIMRHYTHVNTFPGKILISVKKWKEYEKKYTKYADGIVVITHEAKEYYYKHHNWDWNKIYEVPNYVDVKEQSRIQLDPAIIKKYKDKYSLIYFGETGERRGTMDILEAANKLYHKESIHFIIIGTSIYQNKLKQYVNQKKLDNVELTGWMNSDIAMSYIAASKAGLSPLRKNIHHDTTFANKIFQYMFYGKPIIVSNCLSQKKVVQKYNCGLVHEAGNSDDLAEKILKLFHLNNEEYTKYSQNAKKTVNSDLNFSVSGKNLNTLYKNLLYRESAEKIKE